MIRHRPQHSLMLLLTLVVLASACGSAEVEDATATAGGAVEGATTTRLPTASQPAAATTSTPVPWRPLPADGKCRAGMVLRAGESCDHVFPGGEVSTISSEGVSITPVSNRFYVDDNGRGYYESQAGSFKRYESSIEYSVDFGEGPVRFVALKQSDGTFYIETADQPDYADPCSNGMTLEVGESCSWPGGGSFRVGADGYGCFGQGFCFGDDFLLNDFSALRSGSTWTIDGLPEPTAPTTAGQPEAALAVEQSDSDRAVLVALYNSTRGATWGADANWLSDSPIGEWHGVTTNSNGRVIELVLTSNQLTGEIPAELGRLSNLTLLALHDNRLTGEIPAELGRLSNLTLLALRTNQLTGEVPPELGRLSNLTEMVLNSNQLTGEIPAELGRLSNLTVLALFDNRLTGEIPPELGGLSNLTLLWLGANRLTGEIPSELGGLSNLTEMVLNSNQLTGEIPAELGGLSNLTEMVLGSNQLRGEIPAELGGLSNLTVLALFDNRLTGEIPPELGRLSNLTLLWLGPNQLTGCIPEGWRNIAENDLVELNLPDCGAATP